MLVHAFVFLVNSKARSELHVKLPRVRAGNRRDAALKSIFEASCVSTFTEALEEGRRPGATHVLLDVGQVAKIANNMMLGIQMAGAAEALALGVANGLDPVVLSDIISKSSGRNWAFELYNPWPGVMESAPAARGYAGGFGVDLMLKDLGLAAEAAMGSRAVVPLGELARNLYAMHSAQGSGKLDFSSIVNLIRKG